MPAIRAGNVQTKANKQFTIITHLADLLKENPKTAAYTAPLPEAGDHGVPVAVVHPIPREDPPVPPRIPPPQTDWVAFLERRVRLIRIRRWGIY